jgi:cytochrome c
MYRWDYTAGEQSPRAVISANPTSGVAPLTVQFSSAGSRDPDENDSIRYEWDFDGNGTVDSADANPTHTYTQNGTYTAVLRVVDSSGKSDRKTTTIVVGNTAPSITINTPVDGDFFAWGEKIRYSVTVTDPEDGAIDCSRVITTFVLIHDTHGHGEDQQTGCSGTLQTLAEDASHGGYIAGGISVSYTDKGGGGQAALTTTQQSVVQQRRQQPEFANEDVRGLQFPAVAATEPDPGGGQAASAIDPGDYFALNNRYYLGNMTKQITLRYAGGSATNTAGNPRTGFDVRLDSPTGQIVGGGTLVSTGANNNTYTSQTFPLDFTGSHRLYVVFRSITGPGAPTTAMGLVNWVEFAGPGWGQP